MQEAQRRKERRQRATIITSAVVLGAILVGVVIFAVARAQANQPDLSKVVVPPGITETGGIVKPAADGGAAEPVRVTEYLDYQCPICQQFDAQVGPYLKQEIAAGNVEMEYHPINFLDNGGSTTRYSSRSANAAYCTAANGGDIETFSDTLYAEQPEEGGEGLPDERLVQAARDADATAEVESCIADETYTGYVTQQNDLALKQTGDGPRINGTPTVLVDGEQIGDGAFPSLEIVQAAVEGAKR